MRYEDILKKFTASISRLSDRKDLRDNFHDFLNFQMFFFCQNPSEKQIEWFNCELPKAEIYKEAMLLLGDGSENFRDILGEFFMLNVTMGRNGQYFTPEIVCNLMALVTGGSDERASVDDCCCGSGRMLLAHAANCKNPHNTTYYANDIDIICVKMCLINLLLNSLTGVVTCGNGLIPIWVEGRETFILSLKRVDLGGKFMFYPQYRYYTSEESKLLFVAPNPTNVENNSPTSEQLEFTKLVEPIGKGEQLSLF